VIEKIDRYYLEIRSIEKLKSKIKLSDKYYLEKIESRDFELNKFFYKQIGKKHQWIDRLAWQDKDWIKYVSDKNLETYVLKKDNDLIGYFELIYTKDSCEIAYFGILEEYIGKGIGGHLLSEAIKIGLKKTKRIWVHTCSLDHPHAISNYKSVGMKIFKTEELKRKVI